ncbi:hypothetical protein [Teichococcus aestuarii]
MAEQNADTGRKTAERAQTFMLAEALFGRLLGFLFAGGAFAGSVWLAFAGHDWAAVGLGTSIIAGVTAALVWGRTS